MLLATFPAVLAAYFVVGGLGSVSEHPVFVPLLLLPLTLVVTVLGYPLVRNRRLVSGGGFLPFFVAYCLLFSVAAGTRVLEGRRVTLAGFEEEAPSNLFGLARLGDWHYWLAPRSRPMNDIVVVTLPSFAGGALEDARRTQADLIARAVRVQAKGIAFDYALEDSSQADRILCYQVQQAESVGIPVVYGYRVANRPGGPVRVPPTPQIAQCLGPERLGTLTGLREADGWVRMVPTSHMADTTFRSFSWRIAALLAGGEGGLPRTGFVQFVAPDAWPLQMDGVPTQEEAESLRDRFVMVGSSRLEDVHPTPFDSLPGVLIHAVAAHSLRTGDIIRRLDSRWLLPVIFLLCYLLTVLQATGGGVRTLWLGAGIFSAAIVASAGLAIRADVWIDASYPLLAVGGMAGVLSGGARLQRGRIRSRPAPGEPEGEAPGKGTPPFDVFLSHNSNDDLKVAQLGLALRARGLRVWLDEWELIPGRPWQQAIEDAIATVASAAILVGRDGLGPWEVPEMRACLDQCVQRGMPVIPVLLPGAPAQPKLPLFLAGYTWVDLREGLTPEGLDQLEWGITGVRPSRPSSREPSRA